MSDTSIGARQVRDWLMEHPDFLAGDPELLACMEIPHPSGTASLLERQVEILRDEARQLKRQLNHLTGVAGENERRMQRLHQLSLELVATSTATELFRLLVHGLRERFEADGVRLLLQDPESLGLDDQDEVISLRSLARSSSRTSPDSPPEWLDEILHEGQPRCGRLTREKRELLFGKAGAELGSAALLPLGERGLLAIGARDDNRFHPEMGTLFLTLLGQTVEFRLSHESNPPEQQQARA